jgi:hypothetical protein
MLVSVGRKVIALRTVLQQRQFWSRADDNLDAVRALRRSLHERFLPLAQMQYAPIWDDSIHRQAVTPQDHRCVRIHRTD